MKYFIAMSLLWYNCVFSQGFVGKITYEATSNSTVNKERIENNPYISEWEKEKQLERVLTARATNFVLVFNNKEAVFESEYDRRTKKRLGLLMNYTASLSYSNYKYITNLTLNHVLSQGYYTDQVVVLHEPIDWELSQETKMIGDYKCYKATARIEKEQVSKSRNYVKPIVAWYTPEIPVHFGVRNFYGLPGLTMELTTDTQRGQVVFKASKIELNIIEEIKIKKLKGKQITEAEYIEMIQKMNAQRKAR